MNIFPHMENYEHNLGWRKFGWEDLAKVIGSPTHSLAEASPGKTRNAQGMSGVGEEDRQTDRHTEKVV